MPCPEPENALQARWAYRPNPERTPPELGKPVL